MMSIVSLSVLLLLSQSTTPSVRAWAPPRLSGSRRPAWVLRQSTTSPEASMDLPYDYPERRPIDEGLLSLGSESGGRPGAIIETEEELAMKDTVFAEIADGTRRYPEWMRTDYLHGEEETAAVDSSSGPEDSSVAEDDDGSAIDAATLGTWDIYDLQSKYDYEWDPRSGKPDPNVVAMQQPQTRYLPDTPKDDDGIEIGFTSMFGPSNPIDTRTILGTKDSYMIDPETRDESRLTPLFHPNDPEIAFNEEIVEFRQSLDIMETYIDPFLPADMAVPRHTATWHGYPEPTHFAPKNFTNNRFTKPEDKTDFAKLSPHRARQKAVELARSNNAEWLPHGVTKEWHREQRQPYEQVGTLVGTLRKDEASLDPVLVEQMEPALKILGSVVDLLSITKVDASPPTNNALSPLNDDDEGYYEVEDMDNDDFLLNYGLEEVDDDDVDLDEIELVGSRSTGEGAQKPQSLVIRFAYHGLMKNRFGMERWTETLLEDLCGVSVSNVIFEAGFRKRDWYIEGGDAFYAPIT